MRDLVVSGHTIQDLQVSAEVSIAQGDGARSALGTRRFVVLDGLRGIAAFAVIVDHVPSLTLAALTQGRYLAVDFFFVLSGFVLAHAYQSRLDAGMSAAQFMRLRLIRLYPMYLMGLIIGLAVAGYLKMTGGDHTGWKQIIAITGFSVLFLPTPQSLGQYDLLYPFNPPSWTLLFELVANAVYGLFARFLTVRVLMLGLPCFAVAAALTIPQQEDLGAGWKWPHVEIGLIRVMFSFFAGVLIYKLRDRFAYPTIPAWGAALLLLAIVCFPVPEAWRRWFDVLACVLLMPMLVVLAQGAAAKGRIAAIATRLGIMSYGVYVLHQPIYMALRAIWSQLGWSDAPGALNVVLVAGIAGALALAAERLYDVPARRLLSRLIKS